MKCTMCNRPSYNLFENVYALPYGHEFVSRRCAMCEFVASEMVKDDPLWFDEGDAIPDDWALDWAQEVVDDPDGPHSPSAFRAARTFLDCVETHNR